MRGWRWAGAAALAAVALACGDDVDVHVGEGVVKDVDVAEGQVLVDHEDMPGLMPAMTMNFDADPSLLASLEPGQRIRFELEHGPGTFRIRGITVVGEGEAGRSGATLSEVVSEAEPAPPFRLVDQDGQERTLASLRGRVVLVDFVYTNCPGPCPILTALHTEVQRALPADVAERVWLASISLDPARDTPEAMRAYAASHGADLGNWSFLTGDPETIGAVLRDYGVGIAPGEALGEIAHVVVTFLVDGEGNIARRWFGLDHRSKDVVAELTELARSAG
jgi:protein SCO1/2